jgi:N-acetylmuramoyl-L-alanine amidase/chitodextrinase
MRNVVVLLIAVFLISGIAAASCVVVYLDENGTPYGYLHPDAYDIMSALNALPTPPTPEEAGKVLTSAIPSNTKILGFWMEGDMGVVNFSKDVVAGLTEASLTAIFEQVKDTLYQFGIEGSIKLTSDGKLLSDYLPPIQSVQPRTDMEPPRPLVGVNNLAGRKITLSPGHGWFWNGSGWHTQRPVYCSPLNQEDFHNLEMVQYLETYLQQEGATTKLVRCTNKSYGNSPYPGSYPWWQMAACYWLKEAGYPGTVYGPYGTNLGEGGSDSSNDIASRPLSADYDGSDIYLSIHTNGYTGDCTGSCPSGTETYYDSTGGAPTPSHNLANAINPAVMSAITGNVDATWACHGACVKDSSGAYGEIRIPHRAATLTELGFHDTCDRDADSSHLNDSFFRSAAMWGIYKGACDYFGVTPTWAFYSDELVSHDIPATMEVGEYYTVHVTMRNRGVVWKEARAIRLGAVGDSDPFTATTRQTITGEVGPNQTYTFTFTLRPLVNPGTYVTDWRMLREGVTWFGATASQTVEITGVPDTEPPTVPTNLAATPENEVRINLSWTASTDNIGVAGYYVYRDNVKIATTTGTGTTYSDGTCSPSTTYTYEVSAYDGFANESGRSNSAQATTPASSPPTTPTNLHGTGSTTSTISMAWTASTDNVGVVGYRIYRNGVIVGTSAGTTYTDTGLNYNSPYTYEVDAYDAIPNYSGKSDPVELSTTTPSYYTWTRTTSNSDCYIRSGSPNTTGDNAGIQAGWSSTTSIAIRRGLVRWDMTGAPAQAAIVNAAGSVRVKLYCYLRSSNGYRNIDLRKINANWSEGTATWNTMNAAYSGTFATTSVGPVADYTWSWNGFTAGLPEQSRGVQVYNQSETENLYAKIFNDLENTGVGTVPAALPPRLEVDYYDIVAPTGCSISINSGAAYATDPAVTLTLSATDFPSGMGAGAQMQFSDDGTTFSTPEAYATSKNYTLSGGDGLKTVYVKFKDVSGNWSTPVSDTITLDTSAPTGTIQINGGAAYTTTSPVTLTLFSVDSLQMQFSNDGSTWSDWEAYGTSKTWPLSDGDGEKTVYAQYKDAADNVSTELISDDITLDTTGPSAPTVTDEGTYTPSMSELIANWSGASDPESGISGYQYAIGTTSGGNDVVDWTPVTGTTVTRAGLELFSPNTYYFSVKAQNGAGVLGDAANSDGIKPVDDTGTIADAKTLQDGVPNGVVALIDKVVTADFGTYFYVEEADTFSAIRVEADGPAKGTTVSVAGVMSTANYERSITTATVKAGAAGTIPPSRYLRNAFFGGDSSNAYTPGLPGKKGLNNIGLLVDAVGMITHVDTGFMYIDDGSALEDGSGYTGLRVDTSMLSSTKAADLISGDYAVLRGIVTTEPSLSAPLLRLREDADVVALYTPSP